MRCVTSLGVYVSLLAGKWDGAGSSLTESLSPAPG